jgi:uncharacterized protein
MMKRSLAILVTIILIPLAAAAAQKADLAAVPRAMVEGLYAGDYKKVFDMSTSDVRTALGTEEAFGQVFAQITLAYGKYETVLSATAEEKSGWIQALVVCSHQYADITYSVVLDSEGKLAGFTVAVVTPKAAATEKAADDGILREDILLRAGEADETKGILTLPAGEGPFPAVIMMQGSGPSDMNETAFGNTPFRDIADGLAKLGVASIRYDKYTFAHAGLLSKDTALYARFTVAEEYINDAKAAAELLVADKRLSGIYLLGHSQGAMLVPRTMNALGAGVLSGGILLAGTPKHLWEIQYHQNLEAAAALTGEDARAAASLIDDELEKVHSLQNMTEEELLRQTVFGLPAYYQSDEMKVDAAETAINLKARLLICQGGKDWQVTPSDGMEAWKSALDGRLEATYKLYENLTHMLFDMENQPTGTVADYSTGSRVSQTLIADIAAWIMME